MTVAVVHSFSTNTTSWDSRWTIPTAVSLVRQGDSDLAEYEPMIERSGGYAIERIHGRPYSMYPIGPSLLAVPFVAAAEAASWMGLAPSIAVLTEQSKSDRFEAFVASVLMAITAVLIYATARLECSAWWAVLAAGIFAFCTPAWSTASRALWQHGPMMLMLAAAMYLLARARAKPALAAWSAVPLVFACICRPTAMVPAVLLFIYIILRNRRQAIGFLLLAIATAGPWIAYNVAVFDTVLPAYYRPGSFNWSRSNLLEGLAGTLVSPSRGLLIACPVMMLAAVGAAVKLRGRRFTLLDFMLAAAVFLHWLMISSWPIWWGGHCQGPRLFADVVPICMWFMLPVAQWLRGRHVAAWAGVAVLIAASFLANRNLAENPRTKDWNVRPSNIDAAPNRLWDWSDVQFLR